MILQHYMSWWHNDYYQFPINSDLFIICIDPLKHFLKWVNGIPAVFVNVSEKLPSAYSIRRSHQGTWRPLRGSSYRSWIKIFHIDLCTFPDFRTLQECCVTWSDKECQLYLFSESPLCQAVSNALLYILHFVFQSPHSVFFVPSHEFWTWCGQNKFCILLLPLGDSQLKEQLNLDETHNQFSIIDNKIVLPCLCHNSSFVSDTG